MCPYGTPKGHIYGKPKGFSNLCRKPALTLLLKGTITAIDRFSEENSVNLPLSNL